MVWLYFRCVMDIWIYIMAYLFCVKTICIINKLYNIIFFFCNFFKIHFTFQVKNYLPTISTAVGKYPVQQFIWTFVIIAHSPIRLIVVGIYYQYYTSIIKSSLHWCVVLLRFLSTIEIFSLIVLSVFTSSNYYSEYYEIKLFYLII